MVYWSIISEKRRNYILEIAIYLELVDIDK